MQTARNSNGRDRVWEVTMRQASNRIREMREILRERFGVYYSIRACSQRAGIAERAWTGYERGESMPPADSAVAIARVLGVTVEQLDFRRAEVDGEQRAVPAAMTELPERLPCAGTFRVGSYINNCLRPGHLQVIRYSWGKGPGEEDTAVLSVCDVHDEPMAPDAKELGPDLQKLSPSLDRIEGPHLLREQLAMGEEPFWTNVGIAPRTRKWFKTSRRRRRTPDAAAEETGT
jgi:transcriptional regulator with XRE-family HTH domain